MEAHQFFEGKNYRHYHVNHSIAFVDPDDPSIHTNNIERHWSYLRRFVKRNVSLDSINLYIRNFLFFHHTTPNERYYIMINLFINFNSLFKELLS